MTRAIARAPSDGAESGRKDDLLPDLITRQHLPILFLGPEPLLRLLFELGHGAELVVRREVPELGSSASWTFALPFPWACSA